jgi:hypothetical protein
MGISNGSWLEQVRRPGWSWEPDLGMMKPAFLTAQK